jgi:hypothetical protein
VAALGTIGTGSQVRGAAAREPKASTKSAKSEGAAVPLVLSGFADGFRNCSRSQPGSTGFWEVPATEVARIDAALLRHLRSTGLVKRLPYPLADYVRQYLGLLRNEKRIVYVNAFSVGKESVLGRLAETARAKFLRVCDGGGAAWGIEYDTENKAFAAFETNLN